MGGHLTYALRDKKPSTLAKAKEKAIEVEENLRISKMNVDDIPKTKTETKKEKRKDQHEETIWAILKKMDKLSEEFHSWDRTVMNKITALEKAQKSNFVPKGKSFPRKQSDEEKPSSSQVSNTLAPTNIVDQDSSFEDEPYESDESDDDEIDEQTNLVEVDIFNILLGGSYIHHPPLPINEVTNQS